MAQYNHIQSTSSSSWTIAHNLGTNAEVIDVYVANSGNLEKIFPLSVQHTDINTITVTFTTGFTGNARVVG
jgi:hypothetical protein